MLEISDLRAGYGPINVLWDVSLSMRAGAVTAIVGPNGAGKTTLLRAIVGLAPLGRGDIRLRGISLRGTKTWDLARRGVVMIPEGRMVFAAMTVEDNLMMGAFPKAQRARAKTGLERAYDLFPRLRERRAQLAGSLSGGEAQMLAIGRGLMADPEIILVDEPSLGLAPVVVRDILRALSRLKSEGRAIVLVEQNTRLAVANADHVYLMRSGRVLLSQAASKVDLDRLHDLYFARG